MEENYDLKKIAYAQRGMLICLLIHILCVIGAGVGIGTIASIIMFLGEIAALYFVFKLAKALKFSIAAAVVCCILMFIPLVCLITMVFLNGRATKILNDNGIKVGLLGANVKD